MSAATAVAPRSPPLQPSRRRRRSVSNTTPALPHRKSARSKYYVSPVSTGGASLPPLLPHKLLSGVVGIPDAGPSRVITKTEENKYEEGYDSNGEIGPFFDAVKNEINMDVDIEDCDEGLPVSMGVG